MSIYYVGNNEEDYITLNNYGEAFNDLIYFSFDDIKSIDNFIDKVSYAKFIIIEIGAPYGLIYHLSTKVDIPFFVITKKFNNKEKIYNLQLKALDYIDTSNGFEELFLKISNHISFKDLTSPVIALDPFLFNLENHTVTLNGKYIKLSKKQIIILYNLVKNKGQIVSRDELLKKVWGENGKLDTRTIDSHMKIIRNALDTNCIMTIRGVGYMYMPNTSK